MMEQKHQNNLENWRVFWSNLNCKYTLHFQQVFLLIEKKVSTVKYIYYITKERFHYCYIDTKLAYLTCVFPVIQFFFDCLGQTTMDFILQRFQNESVSVHIFKKQILIYKILVSQSQDNKYNFSSFLKNMSPPLINHVPENQGEKHCCILYVQISL